jgi:hypothetical protein
MTGDCLVKYGHIAIGYRPPRSVIARLTDSQFFSAWSRLIGNQAPITDPKNGRTGPKNSVGLQWHVVF